MLTSPDEPKSVAFSQEMIDKWGKMLDELILKVGQLDLADDETLAKGLAEVIARNEAEGQAAEAAIAELKDGKQ